MLSAWNAKMNTSVASSAAMVSGANRGSSVLFEPCQPVRFHQHASQQRARRQRDHDENDHRIQQHAGTAPVATTRPSPGTARWARKPPA